ncbi:Thymus-specific serine protease, partial [Perkinsus chesapeaki]
FFDGVAETLKSKALGGCCGCFCHIRQAHEEVKGLLKTEGGRRIVEAQFGLTPERILEHEENRAFWIRNGLLGMDPATNDPECRENLCNIKNFLIKRFANSSRLTQMRIVPSRSSLRLLGQMYAEVDTLRGTPTTDQSMKH